MLSREEKQTLCRVGPGTPMGALMRQYWVPAMLSSELLSADSDPLRVLLLDSWYDSYRGVVILVRVVDGMLRPKQKVRFMAARRDYEIQTIGVFGPFPREWPELGPGEVGFFTAAIKEVADARVGDTITDANNPCATPLPVAPVVAGW